MPENVCSHCLKPRLKTCINGLNVATVFRLCLYFRPGVRKPLFNPPPPMATLQNGEGDGSSRGRKAWVSEEGFRSPLVFLQKKKITSCFSANTIPPSNTSDFNPHQSSSSFFFKQSACIRQQGKQVLIYSSFYPPSWILHTEQKKLLPVRVVVFSSNHSFLDLSHQPWLGKK